MATSGEITSPVKKVREGDSWQFNKSVIECNRHMLETGLAADVTFLVSDVKDEVHAFRAHKYMLISRSPVFYSMLCGDLAETGEVTVTDVETDAFKQMLSYIYTDELDLKPDCVMFILYASKKYLLPGLTSKCTEFLKDHLDASNACTIHDQSLLFEEGELAERCMKLIKFQTRAAFASDSFLNITHATLAHILDSENLALREVEVFEASMKWAKQKCEEMQEETTGINMRNMLGDCVRKFRFCDMKIEDFSRIVGPADILSQEEEVQLYRYMANKNSFSAPIGFMDKSRLFFNIRTSELKQMQMIGTTSFTIDIECNSNISIDGLVIGKWISRECLLPGLSGLRNVTTSLQRVSVNGEICNISGYKHLNNQTQEVKFNSEVTLNSGKSKLTMTYINDHSYINASSQSKVCVIPEDEITLKAEFTEVKLKSDQSCMPLLGLNCKPV